ncbi:hypothetical protein GGF38_002942 [Coemansia sp. RSA 25]|nr:hypothetical protein GGF38_002942 [Coemansia sp. RSA 25]
MADELTYDEGQSARQMQDIEEWKRRMKEGASQQQAVAADEGAARGSRFLRMFSNGVGAPSLEPPPGLLAQQQPTLLPPPPPPAEAVLQQMAQASFEASLSPASASASVGSGQQRLKAASPAPINEALRGIVPTSVFRKSVQSSSSSSSAGAPAASRAATPARSLPSWLVELSRGRSSSPLAEDQALLTNASLITNASLGAHDLVDALERGFPALHARPRPLDSQSISSLSVQASAGGPPSEACGGDRQAPVMSAAEAPPPPPPEALAMAPPGMLGQQHVMLADGTLLPGGMGPPMGMMPPHPPHPLALGFHPGMMYGMLPGAPPGMLFGPPGMMYGMPPPPHMYSVGMAYPGMPIAVPSSAPEPGLLPPPGQPPNQAFQHHQHQ